MGKTTIPNKLNNKLQAHDRLCEGNEEKKNCQLKYFGIKGSILEACRRTVMLSIDLNFYYTDSTEHKGISTITSK